MHQHLLLVVPYHTVVCQNVCFKKCMNTYELSKWDTHITGQNILKLTSCKIQTSCKKRDCTLKQ
jgi:hypothetical protein